MTTRRIATSPFPSRRDIALPAGVALLVLLLVGWAGGTPDRGEALATEGPRATAAAASGPALVVLVRHAEKAEAPANDPPLSPPGEARAQALAELLADAGITRIHSTDTRRTRDTALPLARRLGVEVELYDSRELEAFAARLATLPGRHLVVGHSNTTDVLSRYLGGDTFGEIVEAWEYDRLYLLTGLTPASTDGLPTRETVLLRFGAPTPAPGASEAPAEARTGGQGGKALPVLR